MSKQLHTNYFTTGTPQLGKQRENKEEILVLRRNVHPERQHNLPQKKSKSKAHDEGGSGVYPRLGIRHILNHYQLLKAQELLSHTVILQDSKIEKSMMRQMARGLFDGDKPYDFYLSAVDYVTAASTTGVISQVKTWASVMGGSANWSALAGLFDEFIIDEVHIELVPSSGGFNIASPAPTLIAFDDDAVSGAPSTYNSVAVYPTCRMIAPAIQGATLSTQADSTGMYPWRVSHRRPYYVPNNSPTANAATTGWTDVGSPSNQLGQTLYYNSTVSATSNVICYTERWSFHARFRCQQ